MIERYAKKYPAFEYDSPSERVLRITFNKPETYNSLDADGHKQLAYIWRDIDEDSDISCVILAAKGKAFSSGGDFSMIKNNIDNWNDTVGAWKEARDLVYNIINCSKPIISAVNGVAVGAGLVAALMSDISIIAKSARVLDGHVRLGVAAGDVACINWVILRTSRCMAKRPSAWVCFHSARKMMNCRPNRKKWPKPLPTAPPMPFAGPSWP